MGSVGPLLKNVEVKIADDGEILVRAESVFHGYWHHPEQTAEVMDSEGFFHTGDIGNLSKDNFLSITDRKKEIFKTSGGKYVAPQMIENMLKESMVVEQAMVVGEGQRFPAALIVPAYGPLQDWCKLKGIAYSTDKEMLTNPQIQAKFQTELDRINERLAQYEKIKRFALIPVAWTIDRGEITPKLSLRRKVILANAAAQIESREQRAESREQRAESREQRTIKVPLTQTDFVLPGQMGFYRGKVRDVYYLPGRLVAVATDRISAFDVVLPRAIPGKGAVLNTVAAHFLRTTADIVPNWLEATPHPAVSIGRLAQPFAVEMVVRAYLVGHAWRTYGAGGRSLCGVPLPDGLRENDPLPGGPIITPSTKAATGHDEDIAWEDILSRGLVPQAHYQTMERYSLALFAEGTRQAAGRGLILADTKYEFGLWAGQVMLMDEVHTPDSSRYFYADGFADRQQAGEAQKQLSKEFVRQWLLTQGFSGQAGRLPPVMDDVFVASVSARYLELAQLLLGQSLTLPNDSAAGQDGILQAVLDWLSHN